MATKPAQTQVCPETNSSPMQERFKLLAGECTPLPDDYAFYLNNLTEGNIITVGDIRAIAALPLLPSGQEWRGIESAPKDGTWVLGYETGINTKYAPHEVMRWGSRFGKDCWFNSADHAIPHATHWRTLPAPPSIEKSGGEK